MTAEPRGLPKCAGLLLVFAALALALPARAGDAFHPRAYRPGETVKFDFEDTDTLFSTELKDGTIQAGAPLKVQEIRIPVSIAVSSDGERTRRTLTISPAAAYRAAPPAALSGTPFKPVSELDKEVPPAFSYSYEDDTDALDNLQKTFAALRKGEVGGFLFYKMEDVHQMQESAAKVPEGFLPGMLHASPRHERKGLGGDFTSAAGQLIYRDTETYEGVKAGYFKVVSLGHEFSMPSLKTYTNFSFTMHVALEGPEQGSLLFGEGQETATVLRGQGKDPLQPVAILQRQFSIRRTR